MSYSWSRNRKGSYSSSVGSSRKKEQPYKVSYGNSQRWEEKLVTMGKMKLRRWKKKTNAGEVKGEEEGYQTHQVEYIKLLNRDERFNVLYKRSIGELEQGFAGPAPAPAPLEESLGKRNRDRDDDSYSSSQDEEW